MILVGTTVYSVFDNQRFLVVKQEIAIDRLPESFDGFKTLQTSNLHGRHFGENQTNLINAINSLEYDVIAFTGDMNDSAAEDDSVRNSQAILELLDGIENKDYMFWVDGNTSPYAIQSYGSAKTGEVTEIGEMLQNKSCKILILPHAIARGDDKIRIAPERSEIGFVWLDSFQDQTTYLSREICSKVKLFQHTAQISFQEINGNNELNILLINVPKQTNLTVEEVKQYCARC